MGVVTLLVDSAQGQLDGIAGGAFGDIVGVAGNTVTAMATLAVVMLGLNMVLQFRPMPAGGILVTLIKLVVIATIGLQWDQFNIIASAVESAMDSLAGAILAGYDMGGGAVSNSLAGAVDLVLSQISEAANVALQPMGWMGGAMFSVILAVGLSAVGALVGIILIFAKVMVTVFISIAPIFIAMSIFDTTKDYFNRWLQSTISYMLYPVVIAAVLGGMVRLVRAFIDNLSVVAVGDSIAAFVPFLVALLILGVVVVLIPSIVSGLSGNFQFTGPVATATRTARTVADVGGAAKAVAGFATKLGGRNGGSGGNDTSSGSGSPAPASSQPLAARIAARSAKY